MTWAIKIDWRFEAVEVIKETEKTVFYTAKWNGRETRSDKRKFLDWRGDEATAHSVVAKLTSASAEHDRRRAANSNWYRERKAEILASVGRNAKRQDAEERLDPKDDSPTAESGDAQIQSSIPIARGP